MDPNAQTLPGQIAAGELTAKSGDLLAKAEQIKALIADLKSANADLEAKLASCNGEVANITTAKTDLEAKLQASSAESDGLKDQIATASANVDALVGSQPEGAQPLDLAGKIALLKVSLDGLNASKADLEAKLQASSAESDGLKNQIATANANVDALIGPQPAGAQPLDLAGKIALLKVSLDGLNANKTDLGSQVQTRDAQVAQLTADLDKSKSEVNALTSAKGTLESEVERLNRQLNDLQKQLQQSSDDGSVLGKAAIAGAATIGAAAVAKKVGGGDDKGVESETPPSPSADTTGANTMGLVAAGATGAALAAGADTTAAPATIDTQATQAEIADLKARLEATTTVLQARDADFNIAKEQLSAAEAKQVELQQQVDALAAANTKLATLQQQLDELSASKAGVDAALTDAQAQLAALQTSFDSLKAEKATIETNFNSRTAEFDALSVKMTALKTDLDAALAARAQLEDTLKKQEAEINGLRAEVQRVKDEGEKSGAARVAEIGVLTAGAATAAAAIKRKDDELNEARAQISGLEQQLNTLQDQLNEAQARVEAGRPTAAPATTATMPDDTPQTTLTEVSSTPASLAVKSAAASAAIAAGATPTTAACPQDLSEAKGIGSVFEQRLYIAGIGTFWELANLSDDDLKRILELNERQLLRMDFNEVRGDALRLARETDSVGRLWEGGQPDDFEPLEGIGRLYEKKLYDAGICTYEALASTSMERLAEICPGTKLRTPVYADWVAQAKRLAAAKSNR